MKEQYGRKKKRGEKGQNTSGGKEIWIKPSQTKERKSIRSILLFLFNTFTCFEFPKTHMMLSTYSYCLLNIKLRSSIILNAIKLVLLIRQIFTSKLLIPEQCQIIGVMES